MSDVPARLTGDGEGKGGRVGEAGDRRRASRVRLVFYVVAALVLAAALIFGGRSLVGPLQRFAAWVQGLGI
ncbi:MAG TPA: hypothetical protein VMW75_02825, partial [Thermoanaerobaculia bacterium]|nr:hypothetical protein [Thermoanaerobaculia bacterium]